MMNLFNIRFLILCIAATAGLLFGSVAQAGHLFTQASNNTPISLNAGQGLTVTQLTYEISSGTSNGAVSLNFGGNWSAGDAIQITIGSWSETFAYDNTVANGGSQNASVLSISSTALVAAGLAPSGQLAWTVVATAGQFTWEGYRIYTAGNTFNGTGAAPINQSQVITVGGGNYSSIANPNQTGVAGTLDGLAGATGQMGGVLAVLDAMSDQSKRDAMQIISPDRSQVVAQSAINTTTAALDTVQVRLDNLRVGMSGQNDVAMLNQTHFAHGSGNAGRGMSSGDDTLDKTVWIKAFGGKADQAGRSGFAGSDSKVVGMMLGTDRMLDNGLVMGVALAYAKTGVDMNDFRNGDNADIKTYQVTGYFAKAFERWFLQGMLSYAYQDYETKRNTHLTGVARGDFNGNMLGTRLVAGVPFQLTEVVTLTPSLGIEAHRINQDGFTEKGAGVLSLNVGSSNADRVRSLLGLELGMLHVLADGSRLRPAIKANWRHDFIRDGMNTTSSFIGGGSAFESVGQKVNQDVYGISARLNWEKTDRIGLAVEVGSEQGDGYDAVNAQLTGTYRF
jgi:outer membrane autotransporter protein